MAEKKLAASAAVSPRGLQQTAEKIVRQTQTRYIGIDIDLFTPSGEMILPSNTVRGLI